MSKSCSNCGAELPDELNFCVECGQRLSPEPADHTPLRCANCGAELSPGIKFCTGCGWKIGMQPQAAAQAPEAGSAPSPDCSANPRVRRILSRYGARRKLSVLAAVTAILWALWAFLLRSTDADYMEPAFWALYFPFLALKLLSYSSSYGRKAGKKLKKAGCSAEQIKTILRDNPFWFKNFRAKSPENGKKLKKTGTAFFAAGWIVTVYSLPAIALPVAVMIVISRSSANFGLAEKGLQFLTAGLLLLTAGKLFKSASARD